MLFYDSSVPLAQRRQKDNLSRFGIKVGGCKSHPDTCPCFSDVGADGGTSSDQAYKCVPFYITNRNYGVFINNPGEVEVEVASEKISRVGTSVAGSNLEFFIIYGENPLQVCLELLPKSTEH